MCRCCQCPASSNADRANTRYAGAAGKTVERKVSFSKRDMVAAAHPLATEAGVEILARGGSAVDAAVAVQMVLTLSSHSHPGIGGGSFMLHYDAKRNATIAFDGREIAPQAATPTMFLGDDGKPIRSADAVRSGKSFGVPGTLRALEAAHAAHGKLPWSALFQPAIRLAENGYALSARTVQQAGNSTILRDTPETRAIFFNADGTPKAVWYGGEKSGARSNDETTRHGRGGCVLPR